CFWGAQEILRQIPGVEFSEVGYAGGDLKNPEYSQVKTGQTGHAEVVKLQYDPQKVGFDKILDVFFRMHDPTTEDRQGNDVGSQYRSVIFYSTDEQKKTAEAKIKEIEKIGFWRSPIVTEIVPFQSYYPAEDYHQDYLVKHPNGYSCHFLRKF